MSTATASRARSFNGGRPRTKRAVQKHPVVMADQTPDCPPTGAHHYVIATPNGALSPGTCKKCGTTRLFRNWEQSTDFIRAEY